MDAFLHAWLWKSGLLFEVWVCFQELSLKPQHGWAELESKSLLGAHLGVQHLLGWATHTRPFPLLNACEDAKPAASKPEAAFWHVLQWRDHDLHMRRVHWEGLVGRERQGKRAAAPPALPLPHTCPVQDCRLKKLKWLLLAFQIPRSSQRKAF